MFYSQDVAENIVAKRGGFLLVIAKTNPKKLIWNGLDLLWGPCNRPHTTEII
jgi:hypothetical protein